MRQEQIYRQLKQHLPQGWFQPARSRQGFGHDLLWALAYALAEFVSVSEALSIEIPPITASGKFLNRHLAGLGLRRLSGESDEQARSRYRREWQPNRSIRSGIIERLKGLSRTLVFFRVDPLSESEDLGEAIQSDLYYPVFEYTTVFTSVISLDTTVQPRWLATPILKKEGSDTPALVNIRLFSGRGSVRIYAQSNSPSSEINLVQDEIPPLDSFAAGILPFLQLDFADVARSPLPVWDYFTPWQQTYLSFFDIPPFTSQYRLPNLYVLRVAVDQLRDWQEQRENLLAVHRQASRLVDSYPFVFVTLRLSGSSGDYSAIIGSETYLPFVVSETFAEILIPQPQGILEIHRDGARDRAFEINFLQETLILRINYG